MTDSNLISKLDSSSYRSVFRAIAGAARSRSLPQLLRLEAAHQALLTGKRTAGRGAAVDAISIEIDNRVQRIFKEGRGPAGAPVAQL